MVGDSYVSLSRTQHRNPPPPRARAGVIIASHVILAFLILSLGAEQLITHKTVVFLLLNNLVANQSFLWYSNNVFNLILHSSHMCPQCLFYLLNQSVCCSTMFFLVRFKPLSRRRWKNMSWRSLLLLKSWSGLR